MCKTCDSTGNVLAYKKVDNQWNQYGFRCFCEDAQRKGHNAPLWFQADKSIYVLKKPEPEPEQIQNKEEEIDDCPF